MPTQALHCCGAGGSRGGGSNGGDGDRGLEARVQELEQRLVQSEAERRLREAQHERDAQVSLHHHTARMPCRPLGAGSSEAQRARISDRFEDAAELRTASRQTLSQPTVKQPLMLCDVTWSLCGG